MTSQESHVPGAGALRQTGRLFALAASVMWLTFKRPFQVRELIEQFWFIASVTKPRASATAARTPAITIPRRWALPFT